MATVRLALRALRLKLRDKPAEGVMPTHTDGELCYNLFEAISSLYKSNKNAFYNMDNVDQVLNDILDGLNSDANFFSDTDGILNINIPISSPQWFDEIVLIASGKAESEDEEGTARAVLAEQQFNEVIKE